MPLHAAADGFHPLRELAGACGDLGTFLPLTLGAILVGGLPAGSVLAGFGLAYLLAAAVYRAPVPVQPMKIAGAVLVTASPALESVIGAGLVLGVVCLAVGALPRLEQLARRIPLVVIAALQAGLGITLGWIALTLLTPDPTAAVLFLLLGLGLLAWRPRWPVALIVLAAGVASLPWLGNPMPSPVVMGGFIAPRWPGLDGLVTGIVLIALPQFPLTLTNAMMVTERTGRELYPRARRLDMRHLALTTGAMNLVCAGFGAMPMCHGAGGLAAHYRFGARTWLVPAGLGLLLLGLGAVAGGETARDLALLPDAMLGTLLLIPAVDLLRLSRPRRFAAAERWWLGGLALIAALSPALAFVGGSIALVLWRRYYRVGKEATDGREE